MVSFFAAQSEIERQAIVDRPCVLDEEGDDAGASFAQRATVVHLVVAVSSRPVFAGHRAGERRPPIELRSRPGRQRRRH